MRWTKALRYERSIETNGIDYRPMGLRNKMSKARMKSKDELNELDG
jgi:hypothetical protein